MFQDLRAERDIFVSNTQVIKLKMKQGKKEN